MPVQNIKIYVLSLSTEVERRNSVAQQLNKIEGLNWTFFDAVTTHSVKNDREWIRSNTPKNIIVGRPLTFGEMACAESHYQIYRRVSTQDESLAIVLEDDFSISDNFVSFINEINNLSEKIPDVVILGYSKVSQCGLARVYKLLQVYPDIKLNNFTIGSVWKESTCGTVGYLITRSAADRLVNEKRFFSLADDWSSIRNIYSLRVTHLRPIVVHEDFERFASSIEAERAPLSKVALNHLDRVRLLKADLLFFMLKTSKFVSRLNRKFLDYLL